MSKTKKAIVGAAFSVFIVGVASIISFEYYEVYLQWILWPGFKVVWMGWTTEFTRKWAFSGAQIITVVSLLSWFSGAFATLVASSRFFLNWILRFIFVCIYVGAVIKTASLIPSLLYMVKTPEYGITVILRAIGALSIVLICCTLFGIAIISTIKEEISASKQRLDFPPA